jgi:uncharacterized membrane protein
MNRRILIAILGSALILIAAILTVYLLSFGFHRSEDQAVWGAFGDYFGGILNPVFALFAFVAVLWSLHLQSKQLGQLALDKQGEEVLQVVKDIDARLTELLKKTTGSTDFLQIVAESERVSITSEKSEPYSRFLRHAKEAGSETEATVRDMCIQVSTMHNFLQRHPQQQSGGFTPVIEYYAIKTSRLIPMLAAAGTLPEPTITFFKVSRAS